MSSNREMLDLAEGRRQTLAAEFWEFLKHNKKWWLLPILAFFGLLGALVVLSGSGAAPFVYTLF